MRVGKTTPCEPLRSVQRARVPRHITHVHAPLQQPRASTLPRRRCCVQPPAPKAAAPCRRLQIPGRRSLSCAKRRAAAARAEQEMRRGVRHTRAPPMTRRCIAPRKSRPLRWSTAGRRRESRATARGRRLHSPGCCRPAAAHPRGPPPWCKSPGASRCHPGRSGRCTCSQGSGDCQCPHHAAKRSAV